MVVEVGSDPITGTVVVGNGEPESFCGWIELVATIEAARYEVGPLVDDLMATPAIEKTLG